jgi:hypothetical protein
MGVNRNPSRRTGRAVSDLNALKTGHSEMPLARVPIYIYIDLRGAATAAAACCLATLPRC